MHQANDLSIWKAHHAIDWHAVTSLVSLRLKAILYEDLRCTASMFIGRQSDVSGHTSACLILRFSLFLVTVLKTCKLRHVIMRHCCGFASIVVFFSNLISSRETVV